jgi:hypothetical protein
VALRPRLAAGVPFRGPGATGRLPTQRARRSPVRQISCPPLLGEAFGDPLGPVRLVHLNMTSRGSAEHRAEVVRQRPRWSTKRVSHTDDSRSGGTQAGLTAGLGRTGGPMAGRAVARRRRGREEPDLRAVLRRCHGPASTYAPRLTVRLPAADDPRTPQGDGSGRAAGRSRRQAMRSLPHGGSAGGRSVQARTVDLC